MTIQEIKLYKCDDCGKTYLTHPGECACEKVNRTGKVVGSFTLEESINGSWKVKCNICSNRIVVHSSNLSRQKSCGCVPRFVNILTVTSHSIRYKCKKCGIISVSDFPVLEWCCENEHE